MTDDPTGRGTHDRADDPHDPADDLEWRLHALLDARAERTRSQLSGPELRARAGAPAGLRRAVPVLAAAAVVLGLGAAVTAIALDHDTRHGTPPGVAPTSGHTGSPAVTRTPLQLPTLVPQPAPSAAVTTPVSTTPAVTVPAVSATPTAVIVPVSEARPPRTVSVPSVPSPTGS